MTNTNITTSTHAATDDAREHLLNLLSGRLERINATPETHVDWAQEASDLLEEVERWATGQHPDGYLILRDPADDVHFIDSGR